jgi:hypothetical protein
VIKGRDRVNENECRHAKKCKEPPRKSELDYGHAVGDPDIYSIDSYLDLPNEDSGVEPSLVVVDALLDMRIPKDFVMPGSVESVVVAGAPVGDDKQGDDDTVLDELVHEPEPGLAAGVVPVEAVSEVVSVSPSVSVVPAPTPTALSPVVLA